MSISPNQLRHIELFEGLTPTQLERIATDFMTRHYKMGEIIFRQGDDGATLYLIQSGQIRIFVNTLDGGETSMIFCGKPGQLFGELAVLDGEPRSASALAISKTTLLGIHRDQLHNHMLQLPQLGINFAKLLSKRVRYNTAQVDSLTSLDVSSRLARKLLELARDYGVTNVNGISIETKLNQTELASLVGATRERVNKALRGFKDAGILATQTGCIYILDMPALKVAAGL